MTKRDAVIWFVCLAVIILGIVFAISRVAKVVGENEKDINRLEAQRSTSVQKGGGRRHSCVPIIGKFITPRRC
jgi:uncharacterized membrane protein